MLVDVTTGAQRVLTFDRKDAGSPRWSPSGDRLAFLAVVPYAKDKKDDSAKKNEDSAQVFVMPMSGGDAKKVTNALGTPGRKGRSRKASQIANGHRFQKVCWLTIVRRGETGGRKAAKNGAPVCSLLIRSDRKPSVQPL